jgi:hypothetical protein
MTSSSRGESPAPAWRAAALGVLDDVLGLLGLVDAVDLVPRDVAVAPRVVAVEAVDHVVGLLRDPAQLVVGELARAGDLALDDEGGHLGHSWWWWIRHRPR